MLIEHKENEMNILFTSINQNPIAIKLIKVGSPSTNNNTYTTDTLTSSQQYTVGDWITSQSGFINFNYDLKKGQNSSNYYKFVTSGGDLEISGIFSSAQKYAYTHLFDGCKTIVDASKAVHKDTLRYFGEHGCEQMYANCTSLTATPSAFPTYPNAWSYAGMFFNCTSLKDCPVTFSFGNTGSYSWMFMNCSSLTGVPDLPNVLTRPFIYNSMFQGCTSLKDSPTISLTTLSDGCCKNMFMNCKNLTGITVNFTNWNDDATENWVKGVAINGEISKPAALSEKRGPSYFPEKWVLKGPDQPLTFRATYNSHPASVQVPANKINGHLYYKYTDQAEWTELRNYGTTFTFMVNRDRGISFKGEPNNVYRDGFFIGPKNSVRSEVYGNINSLYGKTDLAPHKSFYRTFYSTSITDASKLQIPSGVWKESGGQSINFAQMFAHSRIEIAPTLNHTNLSPSCYYYMFDHCTLLKDTPTIKAKSVSLASCEGMFHDCINLSSISDFNFDYVDERGCSNMFAGCYILKDASYLTLSATQLGTNCYDAMFAGCSQLTAVPALPATSLVNSCYRQMFQNCDRLSTAPELPATTLAPLCYDSMFVSCDHLIEIPALPASTLANYCYKEMFRDCSRLASVPDNMLPATDLTVGCYQQMFQGCKLKKSPYLPASTVVLDCYKGMFSSCNRLSSVTVELTSWTDPNNSSDTSFGTSNWLKGVQNSSQSIFNKPESLPVIRGINNIPTSWRVESNPITFTVLELKPGYDHAYMRLTQSSNEGTLLNNMYCKVNHGDWVKYKYDVVSCLYAGDKISFSNRNNTLSFDSNNFAQFEIQNNKFAVEGNIQSLLNYSNETSDFCFYNLFYLCHRLFDASKLQLPANHLKRLCYYQMFMNCYQLSAAPQLPATDLGPYCYYGMFKVCSALSTAPQLPATQLDENCYANMFQQCTSLTDAPHLPAPSMAPYCYQDMFIYCSNLSSVSVEFTRWEHFQQDYTSYWLYDVAENGTFYKPSDLTEIYDANHIPTNWTVINRD